MTQLSESSAPALSPTIITDHEEAIVRLMTNYERHSALQLMCARLTLLADEARCQLKYGLEAILLTTAAEVMIFSIEISAAPYAPVFIHRLEQAIERVQLGFDDTGSLVRQAAMH